MKKLFILSLVVAFSFLGAQAFASPPIKPPVEGFIIDSYTKIECVGDVTEKEAYDWTYFEGVGMLQNQNVTLGMAVNYLLDQYGTLAGISTTDGINPIDPAYLPYIDFILAHAGEAILLQNLGFAEGAQIAYQQDFDAKKGSTFFEKTFKAISNTDTTNPNNLTVDKTINYDDAGDAVTGDGTATHLEKLAMSVVSVGSAGSTSTAQQARQLLHLCPWTQGSSSTTTVPGYPPTNEGIAAGSEFDVTKINFKSKSVVNTTDNPALSYDVTADGVGSISAGFVVDLWEGREGDVWSTYQPHQPWIDLVNTIWAIHNTDTNNPTLIDHPDVVWVQEKQPFLASRTSYSEHASADGVWKFTKNVSYESVMPGVTTAASSLPINNVP